MEFPESLKNTMSRIFDDGLDEVLIFALIFIFVLLSGRTNEGPENNTVNCGILPLILIGIFLLLYYGISRTESGKEQDYDPV